MFYCAALLKWQWAARLQTLSLQLNIGCFSFFFFFVCFRPFFFGLSSQSSRHIVYLEPTDSLVVGSQSDRMSQGFEDIAFMAFNAKCTQHKSLSLLEF